MCIGHELLREDLNSKKETAFYNCISYKMSSYIFFSLGNVSFHGREIKIQNKNCAKCIQIMFLNNLKQNFSISNSN